MALGAPRSAGARRPRPISPGQLSRAAIRGQPPEATYLEEWERPAFDWCREHGIPVAFVVAGGYTGANLDVPGVVDLHRLTLGTVTA